MCFCELISRAANQIVFGGRDKPTRIYGSSKWPSSNAKMGLCHATLGTTCLSCRVYCLSRRRPGSLRIEISCAKARIRLQTEGGIRSPPKPTCKDAITPDEGSKQAIEGKLGLFHR